MKAAKTADEYFAAQTSFVEEQLVLRTLILETGLEETIKWGIPVYVWNKHNVIGMCAFKAHFGIWFYQGALLADTTKKLINANEGNTKSLRQWRMKNVRDIDRTLIQQYIYESIDNFKAGRIQLPEKNKPLLLPDELISDLKKHGLTATFEALSLTKKRDFAEYISAAKRTETKQNRLEKIRPMIEQNIGLNDQYK